MAAPAKLALCLCLAAWVNSALSADTPPPVCSDPAYRAFDFWIGEWEVRTEDGTFAGTNIITSAEQGCLLIERWTGAQGNTGQSYNFYDPVKGKWRQLWVSPGVIIDYQGGFEDGAMRLEGNIHYHANKQNARFRGAWTPRSDGSVLQDLQQWDSEQQAWAPWFKGIYRRKSDKPAS